MEELLRNEFQIAEDELQKTVLYQRRNGGKLEQILVRLGEATRMYQFFHL